MKNTKPRLIKLFKKGYRTPQIAKIAKKIKEPSTTIHYYSLQRKEVRERGRKINEGFCIYVLINVSPSEYEYDWSRYESRIASEIAKHKEVESVDIVAGGWDLILKIRTKDQDEYYDFLRKVISRVSIQKSVSLISLRQLKTDFVLMQQNARALQFFCKTEI